MTTPAVGVPGQQTPRDARSAVSCGVRFATRATRLLLPAALAATFAVAWLASLAAPALADTPPNSVRLPATYDVTASIQWKPATMDVTSVAHVTNDTADDINTLTFNLAAQRLGSIDIGDVQVGGDPLDPSNVTVDGQSLIVDLPNPLAAGDTVNVSISYSAVFNSKTGGHRYLFMKHAGIVTAYRWIPWLSRAQQFDPRPERESWVTGVSDQVNVTINSDRPVDIASSGERTSDSTETSQTFTATNVRDFNFSAAPKYRIRTAHWRGVTIQLFYRRLPAKFVLQKAKAAMSAYADEVGPYPYPTLDIGEIPNGVGMELPGMVWIDSSLSRSRLPYIISHELAHQWFYGVIGNNQGTDPYLDEAMADFMSRNLLNYWQNSRCNPQELDLTVWDYSKFCYYEVVYVQGSAYMRDYMNQVGADIFWQGMQSFYNDYQFQIAGTQKLWDELDAASGFDSAQHADRFPNLFPPS